RHHLLPACKPFPLFNLQTYGTYVPCVADLRVIERSDTHESAGADWHVVVTAGVKSSPDFEGPAAGCPARCAAYIRAIPGVAAGENNAGHDGADWNPGVSFPRIRYRFIFGHVPACPGALSMVWIQINFAQCICHCGHVFRQTERPHDLAILLRIINDEIVAVVGGAGIGRKTAPIGKPSLRLRGGGL